MSNYILNIKIPISSIDDIAVRNKAKDILKDIQLPDDSEIKLQEVFYSKVPRKVRL